MELKNCESCGAVFVDPIRAICRDCYYKEEEAFKKVYRFLSKKKNREATISEIVAATEVEEELIIKFMKQNRLRASQFPKLAYPCENCGVDIVEGKLCVNCSTTIKKNLAQYHEVEKKKAQEQKEQQTVYYTFNKNKEKNNK